MKREGCLVTVEGIDGAGKSEVVKTLEAVLSDYDCRVLMVREPGGTSIGEQMRKVLHDLKNERMTPRAAACFYTGARAQLVCEKIGPHLKSGGIVLCDRYSDSTLAYQGFGDGLDLGQLREMQAMATGGIVPDLTLLFDVDPEVGLARRRECGGELNRMDLLALEYYRRVQEGYRFLVDDDLSNRWETIDASRSFSEVYEEAEKIVLGRLRAAGMLGVSRGLMDSIRWGDEGPTNS